MLRVRDLLDRRVVGDFVGRAEELCTLREILADGGAVVVHLHGIPGIGKSRLLAAFAHYAQAEGATVIRLDCRGIEPTEAGVLTELAMASGGSLGSAVEIAARLGRVGTKVIVALDTYEVFRLMDTWVRRVFLPILPDNVRFVLCGREPPVTAWLSDPGWQGLFKSVRLESLEQQDAAKLLCRAGVTADDARHLSSVCHGHPLALTLAETFGKAARIAMVLGETAYVMTQREYSARGDDPRLTHRPASRAASWSAAEQSTIPALARSNRPRSRVSPG